MSRARGVLAWSAVAVMVLATAALIGWRVHGGSWVRVETPSMGTTAPVGTLLWIEPVDLDEVEVGDLITFRPPGSARTYSHLVTSLNSDGTLSTQGRITGPDPWRITEDEIVGRAALVWPGAGWVITAAPVLGAGAFLLWLLVRRIRDRDLREPAAVLGAAVVVAVALVAYKPLLGAEQISFEATGSSAHATYVGTGLLPVRLSAPRGDAVVLGPGEVGGVDATRDRDADLQPHRFTVALGPAIGWTWWLGLVSVCFVPAILTTVRLRVQPPARAH